MPESNSETEAATRRRAKVSLKDVFTEFIGHRDNWLFVGLCLTIAIYLVISGPVPLDLAWFVMGWVIFIPQEYFTHIYILHMRVPKIERLYLWCYRLHYGHHDFPKRHDLMYMPLWLTLPMMLANLLLLWAVTPDPRALLASFCGALAGYIIFEWSHLLCHVPYIPKSNLWRHLRNQHLLHHFFSEKHWYAVAAPSLFMDQLMGSNGARIDIARSDTCRYLGLSPEHRWIKKARLRFAARSSGDPSCSRLWLVGTQKG